MPRCIRNFWLDADIDGRRGRFTSGPQSKDGGFRLHIHNREHGDISPVALHIIGRVCGGKLRLTVENGDHPVFEKEMER